MSTQPSRPRRPFRGGRKPKIVGYDLAEVIGRGAAGVVYRARQTAVDREVALKVLHAHLKDNPRLVRRMQREARTTARLAHPNVVCAVDMGEVDGRFWFAMEYVDGPSLHLRLRQEGRLKEREALRLFIPLCEALEHLYEHGVVHRDIKPANILIDGKGGARLADLGLAFADDDPSITGQGGTLGTPHYISPEQAVDPTGADVRSDIWSFGATLFQAVCGRPPFSGDSTAEILSGVLYGRIPDPHELEPSLSKRLTLVLRKCMSRDPEGRYQVPHELLLDLERVRERRAPKIARRALDPVQSRHDPRNTWLAAIGVVVCLLAVGGILAYRHLVREDGQGEATVGELVPYTPLEVLVVRLESDELPATLFSAYSDVLDELPPEYATRADTVKGTLMDHLRRRVRRVRDELRHQVRESIRGRDLAGAQALLEAGLEQRLVSETGFPSSELAPNGVDIAPWRGQLAGELRSATDAVSRELEVKLAQYHERTLDDVKALARRQDWRKAFQRIRFGSPQQVLEDAGFGEFSLPEGLLDELVAPVRISFDLERERLTDAWIRVDRSLKEFVATRADTLEEKLAAGPPRLDAGAQLEEDFEAELFDRGLNRARMPDGLPKTALAMLARRARFMREEEVRLLELDARHAFDDTERLAGVYLRERRYREAQELWQEATLDLNQEPRALGSSWRTELLRRFSAGREEARLLDALFERTAERIVELNGRSVSFLVGRVDVPDVRIVSGVDPRNEGFEVRSGGVSGRYRLRELEGAQLERFAGCEVPASLSAEERLALALFRFHDGRPTSAADAMNSGPLPEGELGLELVFTLRGRLAEAEESERLLSRAREVEARRRLAIVLDERRRERNPRQVVALIKELLRDYGDVPLVRSRRTELLDLREHLGNTRELSEEELFERQYAATSFHYPARRAVRMMYDFQQPEVGAWGLGDWSFDNVGLVLQERVGSWSELLQSNGPRLLLRKPFLADPDFELELVVEQLASSGPPQLFWISAAGFQVAFAGPGLPGKERRDSRFLWGTEDASSFLERLRSGEGEGVPRLLESEKTHRITIRGNRRLGRLEILLDARSLLETHTEPPDPHALFVELRSFEPVRLLRVELAGAR